ncbi:MAG: hypothetical protein KBI47_16505 [Armatimonadetes bacterium]|nr:hypothetical protein [Armatimonadota bacterium]
MASLVVTAGLCDGPALRGEEYHRFAAELAHYEYGPLPDGFPHSFVSVFNGWVDGTIQPDARPPRDAARLIHVGDDKMCDAISVVSLHQGRPTRLVQTFFFFVVAVDTGDATFGSPQAAGDFVSQLAGSLFTEGRRIELTTEEGQPGRFHGRQNTEWSDFEEAMAKRTWLDTLEWWLDPGQLLLVFIKTYPGYSRFPYMRADLNREWFSPHLTRQPSPE